MTKRQQVITTVTFPLDELPHIVQTQYNDPNRRIARVFKSDTDTYTAIIRDWIFS